jgi:hypothetical protein
MEATSTVSSGGDNHGVTSEMPSLGDILVKKTFETHAKPLPVDRRPPKMPVFGLVRT